MAYQRLSETTQTLYAELLEQTIHADATAAALGVPSGSFVSKEIKGRTYWYLQRLEGERKRQHYLGPESPELLRWLEGVREARDDLRHDAERRSELCAMLAAGGASTPSPAVAKVLELLAEANVFRWGGVLVGTHALALMANMLGVRLEGAVLRTQDLDIAHDPVIGVALAGDAPAVDVAQHLKNGDLDFLPVPGFDRNDPSTSFKFRGSELRVDFLTPMRGPESERPLYLRKFKVAAQPLRFLDFLIEDSAQVAVIARGGILVNVPDPARFALHKLWISKKRPVSEHAKSRKDIRQAELLLEVLLDERPDDLLRAWRALESTKSPRRRVAKALDHVDPDLRSRLEGMISTPGHA